MYHLDPVKFHAAPGLAYQATLKKTKEKLELVTNDYLLLIVERDIRGEICHAIHLYGKTNKKSMNDYDNNKESLCFRYWDVNNLFGWAMSQKPTVNLNGSKMLLNFRFHKRL